MENPNPKMCQFYHKQHNTEHNATINFESLIIDQILIQIENSLKMLVSASKWKWLFDPSALF